jgi:hypothetical protein
MPCRGSTSRPIPPVSSVAGGDDHLGHAARPFVLHTYVCNVETMSSENDVASSITLFNSWTSPEGI